MIAQLITVAAIAAGWFAFVVPMRALDRRRGKK